MAGERSLREPLGTSSGQTGSASLAFELLKLAVPMFISRVSFVIMKATDISLLGHTGEKYLTAASLSDLWTSTTGVFVQTRVVGTFCGQAYGAGNKMLTGIWLQVSYVWLSGICVLVAISWCFTGAVLRLGGFKENLLENAQYFALVLMLCLPARVAFSQLSTYFASQKILRPGMICATIGMAFNLIFGLIVVLGIPIPGWKGLGFVACPWITTAMEYVQLAILWYVFCHCKKLHLECWPGWSREHITRERLWRYFQLYWPAALSVAESFWRVAIIGWVAASLDEVNVAVWSAGYRICWAVLTFLGSLAGAMGVKLAISLGSGNIDDAKHVVRVALLLIVITLAILSLIILVFPRYCGLIFSQDDSFVDRFVEVSVPFTGFVALMNFATASEVVLTTTGRNRTVLVLSLLGSWVGQVPCVFLFTTFWRNDLIGVYAGANVGYALLCVLYIVAIMKLDWNALVEEARIRSETQSAATGPAQGTTVSLQLQSSEEAADAKKKEEEQSQTV